MQAYAASADTSLGLRRCVVRVLFVLKGDRMRKMRFSFWGLTRFECVLWALSVLVMLAGYCIAPENGLLNLAASLIGVTALIFVAKGRVAGQVLTVVFALFYGAISYELRYYGEMITYLFMTAPIALMSVISWMRHPYQDSAEVEVNTLSRGQKVFVAGASAGVTVLFYFILKALGTANLPVSTVSVTTSFLACSLTYFRSPFYALGYAANDVVLIVLWTLAALEDPSYLVMAACFFMFLLNDLYGFFNWQRMKKRQQNG